MMIMSFLHIYGRGRWKKHTPNEHLGFSHVSHSTGILLSFARSEGHMFGKMIVPVVLEGQIILFGIRHLLSILQQPNSDFWWVEPTHMTDEVVGLIQFSWCMAIHLNLGWSYQEQNDLKLNRSEK